MKSGLAGLRYGLCSPDPSSAARPDSSYFLPAFFFAAQKAFNLADNFARVAGLSRFFLAAGAERNGDLARRRFAHLVF